AIANRAILPLAGLAILAAARPGPLRPAACGGGGASGGGCHRGAGFRPGASPRPPAPYVALGFPALFPQAADPSFPRDRVLVRSPGLSRSSGPTVGWASG